MSLADPPITPASEPYWAATRERRLAYQWCARCSRWVHYPRPRCPGCGGTDVEWRDPGTDFRVYSWARHRGRGDASAFVVALVQITDGLRVVANIVGDTDGIEVDRPLTLTWQPLEDGRAIPAFVLRS